MIYDADEIRNWNTDTEIDGKWLCARPMRPTGLWGFRDRIRTAWLVLTGKCDGVKWHKQ